MSDLKAKEPVSGFVSGSGSSTSRNSQPKLRFVKVVDGRKQPIRGLWRRGDVFYARLAMRSTDGSVRDKRVPLKARTVSAAKDELAILRKQNREGSLERPREASRLASYIPRYLEYAKLSKRPRTAKLEAMHLRHWSRAIGSLKLDQIGNRHVLEFRTKKLAEGWSKRSCNLSLVILRNLFRHSKDEGLVSSIPFAGIKSMKHVPQRRRLYAIEEIDAICEAGIRAARFGQQLADYIRLMAFCGSRCEETLHLRWTDVDWEQEQLTIGSDGQSKNHEARVVDLNPSLASHLRGMSSRRQDDSPWLFPSPRLKGRRATNFKETLRIAKAEAGDDTFGYHHCRVFFASRCVMAGVDFRTTASWLGHRDGGVLLSKVYARLSDEHKRRAAAKLEIG